MTEDELVEKVARQIWMDDSGSDAGWPAGSGLRKDGVCWHIATQIHAIYKEAGYARLAEDQSLPDLPPLGTRHDDPRYLDSWLRDMAEKTQRDMLKAGWRKVILEVKDGS